MKRHWETSDPYYDARTSGSHKLNNHLEELANKSIRYIDSDYLDFHHLLAGQSPQHKQSGEQQTAVIISGDHNGSENVQDRQATTVEKRIQHTEIDQENAVLVANTRALEGDAMHDNGVQDRQATTVENGLELSDSLPDDLGRCARMMNVRPRNGSRDDDDDAVRVPMCPRMSSESENESETIQRKLRQASDGYRKVLLGRLENFKRNYSELRRFKKTVVEFENSVKKEAKQLRRYLKGGMPEDCSAAEEHDTDGDDAEVLLNELAIVEQQTPTDKHLAIVPSERHLEITAQPIEPAATVEFRRRVLSDLNQPFHKDEYTELLKLFEGAHRRSYPDVRKMLTEHRYKREKRWKVLRGFFFWFENNTQIGSFEPWKDRECLAVL